MLHYRNFHCLIADFLSQKYKTLSQKGEAVESCQESVQALDSASPAPESNRDWSDNTSLDSGLNSLQPVITLPQVTLQPEEQEEPKVFSADLGSTSADLGSTSVCSSHCTDHGLPSVEEETTSQDSVDQKGPAESKEEPAPGPTADAEENEEQQEGEMEPVVVQGKRNSTGKAKATPKRRSGRSINKR